MRRTQLRLLLAVPFTLTLALSLGLAGMAWGAEWQGKVDPWVLDRAASAAPVEFLVVLAEQADVAAAARLQGKLAKGRYVVEKLRAMAERTQGPVLRDLAARRAEVRPYWIANMIWVRADAATIEAMARRPDVARVSANPSVAMPALPPNEPADPLRVPAAVEPGVTTIGAPTFWAEGFDGQNIVVAGEDTGYDWDHPALKNHYRGWDGATADHNYNWHDAIHSGGGVCGANSAEPCDDNSHGTHTMGTMVGDDGGSNQIGVAPGARWIGCRNMDQGNGTPATYSECFQFFIAPTDLADANPDPSKSPHVINNSWGCPPSEGCTDPNVLKTVVENVRAAGIVVVVSAGNSGSGCSSVSDPAAIYDASFSVGATDNAGSTIASFSSRGPVTVDGSNRLKPDISAPGVSVRSSVPGTGYGIKSGTSMAGPHVAGAVAVLLSAAPGLVGDVTGVEDCFTGTALPRSNTQTCGSIPAGDVPNNVFGYGRLQLVWPLPQTCVGSLLFQDGFETGDTAAWSLTVP